MKESPMEDSPPADPAPAACPARELSFGQAGADERGALDLVTPHDIASRVGDHDFAAFDGFNAPEAEFGLRHAVPALAGGKP